MSSTNCQFHFLSRSFTIPKFYPRLTCLLWFVFSRNRTSSSTGVLHGGSLLALSTLSSKIWRQGKS
ncbi:hypothetical protein CARUB_v10018826mg, partial [Capsella rubella]